ncbi:MAG: hypothetical protein M1825_003912 [Sarcosagium campestre]|nr:MAG: hypothetical protein M1825_003912 [Sarcosagium campestre]
MSAATTCPVWKASIRLPSTATILDLELTDPNSSLRTTPALFDPKLTFLAFVRPSLIPSHLAASSPLSVLTSDAATESWFDDALLHAATDDALQPRNRDVPEWWKQQRLPSDVGILTRVQDQGPDPFNDRPNITEVLFYASLSGAATPTGQLNGLPTSSPELIQVLALPLSSDLLYKPLGIPNSAEKKKSRRKLQKSRLGHDLASSYPPSSPVSPLSKLKRQRVTSLLDNAAENRRKMRRLGQQLVRPTASAPPAMPLTSPRSKGASLRNPELKRTLALAKAIAEGDKEAEARVSKLALARAIWNVYAGQKCETTY